MVLTPEASAAAEVAPRALTIARVLLVLQACVMTVVLGIAGLIVMALAVLGASDTWAQNGVGALAVGFGILALLGLVGLTPLGLLWLSQRRRRWVPWVIVGTELAGALGVACLTGLGIRDSGAGAGVVDIVSAVVPVATSALLVGSNRVRRYYAGQG